MWSFIVPLPQSSLSAGRITVTAFTARSPVSNRGMAFGPPVTTSAFTSPAAQLQPRIVDPPSTHNLLCGCSNSCSLRRDQPPSGTSNNARVTVRIVERIIDLLLAPARSSRRAREGRRSRASEQSGESRKECLLLLTSPCGNLLTRDQRGPQPRPAGSAPITSTPTPPPSRL